jgi:hypothetical protein
VIGGDGCITGGLTGCVPVAGAFGGVFAVSTFGLSAVSNFATSGFLAEELASSTSIPMPLDVPCSAAIFQPPLSSWAISGAFSVCKFAILFLLPDLKTRNITPPTVHAIANTNSPLTIEFWCNGLEPLFAATFMVS